MTKAEYNIIYEDLLKKRVIFLDGEITDTLAHIIISKLLYLDSISNEDEWAKVREAIIEQAIN